jgi:hypothetical protein
MSSRPRSSGSFNNGVPAIRSPVRTISCKSASEVPTRMPILLVASTPPTPWVNAPSFPATQSRWSHCRPCERCLGYSFRRWVQRSCQWQSLRRPRALCERCPECLPHRLQPQSTLPHRENWRPRRLAAVGAAVPVLAMSLLSGSRHDPDPEADCSLLKESRTAQKMRQTAPLARFPLNIPAAAMGRSGNAALVSVGGFAPGLLRHPEYRLADGIIADDFLDLGVGVQPRPQ